MADGFVKSVDNVANNAYTALPSEGPAFVCTTRESANSSPAHFHWTQVLKFSKKQTWLMVSKPPDQPFRVHSRLSLQAVQHAPARETSPRRSFSCAQYPVACDSAIVVITGYFRLPGLPQLGPCLRPWWSISSTISLFCRNHAFIGACILMLGPVGPGFNDIQKHICDWYKH